MLQNGEGFPASLKAWLVTGDLHGNDLPLPPHSGTANGQQKVNSRDVRGDVATLEKRMSPVAVPPECGTGLVGILLFHDPTTFPKRSNVHSVADGLTAQALQRLLGWSFLEGI